MKLKHPLSLMLDYFKIPTSKNSGSTSSKKSNRILRWQNLATLPPKKQFKLLTQLCLNAGAEDLNSTDLIERLKTFLLDPTLQLAQQALARTALMILYILKDDVSEKEKTNCLQQLALALTVLEYAHPKLALALMALIKKTQGDLKTYSQLQLKFNLTDLLSSLPDTQFGADAETQFFVGVMMASSEVDKMVDQLCQQRLFVENQRQAYLSLDLMKNKLEKQHINTLFSNIMSTSNFEPFRGLLAAEQQISLVIIENMLSDQQIDQILQLLCQKLKGAWCDQDVASILFATIHKRLSWQQAKQVFGLLTEFIDPVTRLAIIRIIATFTSAPEFLSTQLDNELVFAPVTVAIGNNFDSQQVDKIFPLLCQQMESERDREQEVAVLALATLRDKLNPSQLKKLFELFHQKLLSHKNLELKQVIENALVVIEKKLTKADVQEIFPALFNELKNSDITIRETAVHAIVPIIDKLDPKQIQEVYQVLFSHLTDSTSPSLFTNLSKDAEDQAWCYHLQKVIRAFSPDQIKLILPFVHQQLENHSLITQEFALHVLTVIGNTLSKDEINAIFPSLIKALNKAEVKFTDRTYNQLDIKAVTEAIVAIADKLETNQADEIFAIYSQKRNVQESVQVELISAIGTKLSSEHRENAFNLLIKLTKFADRAYVKKEAAQAILALSTLTENFKFVEAKLEIGKMIAKIGAPKIVSPDLLVEELKSIGLIKDPETKRKQAKNVIEYYFKNTCELSIKRNMKNTFENAREELSYLSKRQSTFSLHRHQWQTSNFSVSNPITYDCSQTWGECMKIIQESMKNENNLTEEDQAFLRQTGSGWTNQQSKVPSFQITPQ